MRHSLIDFADYLSAPQSECSHRFFFFFWVKPEDDENTIKLLTFAINILYVGKTSFASHTKLKAEATQ